MTTSTTDTLKSSRNVDNRRRRKLALSTLTILFLLIGFIWLFYYLIWGQFKVYTDNAYVNGNLVQLNSQVAGTVVEINTDDTYLVEKGNALVKLDPADMEIAFERAKADLGLTVRQVRQAYENAEQAQATLLLRNADLMKAQLDLQRRNGLVGERAISSEEMYHTRTALQTAQSQYDVSLHSLRSALAVVENSHLYTHPEVERAKAAFRTAYLNLLRTTVIAPVTGFVAKRNVQVGQSIAVNTAMLAIVPLNQIWVDANFKESQLSNLRVGQPVLLYADAYSHVTYHGKVIGLSPGTGSAFSLLPPQNATGNWIKIVQRLPVRIGLDPQEIKNNPLQIGLSMHVTVNTHDRRGYRMAQVALQKQFYYTDIFANQLADAEQTINKILVQNAPENVSLPALGLTKDPVDVN